MVGIALLNEGYEPHSVPPLGQSPDCSLTFLPRSHSRSGEKLLSLQPDANWVNPPITQQPEETSAGVTSVLPPATNKHLNASENKFWEELISYFPWYGTGHIENASDNSSIVACVFVTTVTFLPNRCLATMRGFLPSRCLATIDGIHTDSNMIS
jgi:hypothetical protein